MQSLWSRSLGRVSAGTAFLICALWISICAAAPEFIWRGLEIFLSHPSWANLLSVLLIALILVFFIEPIMERIRDRLGPRGQPATAGANSRGVLFSVGVSLAFALTSVSLHEAMLAFVSDQGVSSAGTVTGLNAGIRLTAAWAIVPFCVALAWQGARHRWFVMPTGLIGAASPFIAGLLFDWDIKTIVATAIPCLLIQFLGYRRLTGFPDDGAFARCAPVVAGVAAAWLLAALIFDAVATALHADWPRLYSLHDLLVDARFYLGWALGLVLAPFPSDRKQGAA
ncbi:hypothetical protein [Kaistia algarum]|uniref:hypothetical protein n=1 Tax=Kaistia algarum TaxID=2083279 RepID=UPI002251EF3C|nr:hypothetical protein [Kaistia algarum]MCX5514870.1 hypothetical protein [Kaistia algarum]